MRFAVALALALLAGPASISMPAQSTTAKPPARLGASTFGLTVDGIMRGPDLVGWPPSALRWSADSRTLYFEWRKPGEDEASTYAVGRDGGEPRKLSEEEARDTPPASGRWDRARARALFIDRGDIVIYDARAGRRIHVTKTAGAESGPRWARDDTHVTFVRDGNLFLVPVKADGAPLLTQLTDVSARRPEPRQTESQKFLSEEEAKLIEHVREEKERKKKES